MVIPAIDHVHVAADQALKRIESQAPYGDFHAAFAKFLDDVLTPIASESFGVKVGRPPEQRSAKKQRGGSN
jgi:hypothetical protein